MTIPVPSYLTVVEQALPLRTCDIEIFPLFTAFLTGLQLIVSNNILVQFCLWWQGYISGGWVLAHSGYRTSAVVLN